MLKKTITYTDYDGVERKEDFWFNLNKAEIVEMEMVSPYGYEKMVENIIAENDSKRLIEIFKEFILNAYGKKSPDGKRFVKSKELREEFAQTEAYVELFMELANDAKAAADFMNGVFPQVKDQDKPEIAVVQ